MSDAFQSAFDYSFAAGKTAAEQMHHADATIHFEAALVEARRIDLADERLCELLRCLADCYIATDKTAEARHCIDEAVAVAFKIFGTSSERIVPYLQRQAWAFRREGNASKVREIYSRCIAIRESEFGAVHADVGRLYREWANMEWIWLDSSKADVLFRRAHQLLSATLAADDNEMTELVEDIVDFLMFVSRFDHAEKIINQHIQNLFKITGKRSAIVAMRLQLAKLFQKTGKYCDHLYEQISNDVQVLSPMPASRIWIQLGHQYRAQASHKKALSAYLKALALLEDELGLEHPLLVAPLDCIVSLCLNRALCNHVPFCQRMVKILENVKGAEHPDTQHALISLGNQYLFEGNLNEANRMFQLVVSRFERSRCSDKSAITNALISLAIGLHKTKEFERSTECLVRAEKILWPLIENLREDEMLGGFLHTQLIRIFNNKLRNFQATKDLEFAGLEKEKIDAITLGKTWGTLLACYRRNNLLRVDE